MGCLNSKSHEEELAELSLHRDMEKIHQFLMGRSTVDDLWMQFDSNFDSKVDTTEFGDLIYHALIYFAKMRDPMEENEIPSRESQEAMINRLILRFNTNQDERISKHEFKKFANFLQTEKFEFMNELDITLTRCSKKSSEKDEGISLPHTNNLESLESQDFDDTQ